MGSSHAAPLPSNIVVVVRVRPEQPDHASFFSGEAVRGGIGVEEGSTPHRRYVWMTTEGEGVTVGGPTSTLPRLATTKRFYPDDVFGPKEAQVDVYERAVARLVAAVPLGINASVLAYGQTGSGRGALLKTGMQRGQVCHRMCGRAHSTVNNRSDRTASLLHSQNLPSRIACSIQARRTPWWGSPHTLQTWASCPALSTIYLPSSRSSLRPRGGSGA